MIKIIQSLWMILIFINVALMSLWCCIPYLKFLSGYFVHEVIGVGVYLEARVRGWCGGSPREISSAQSTVSENPNKQSGCVWEILSCLPISKITYRDRTSLWRTFFWVPIAKVRLLAQTINTVTEFNKHTDWDELLDINLSGEHFQNIVSGEHFQKNIVRGEHFQKRAMHILNCTQRDS